MQLLVPNMSASMLAFLLGLAVICVYAQHSECDALRKELEEKYEVLKAENRQLVEGLGQLQQEMSKLKVLSHLTSNVRSLQLCNPVLFIF